MRMAMKKCFTPALGWETLDNLKIT
uniref:Uncharacterized protein n=1 Tax=Tetranychus urticae TaxID=32264 RepID=T1KP04_TETUR